MKKRPPADPEITRKRKKQTDEPAVVRLENRTPQPPPTYIAIHELGESDLRDLRDGVAPNWLREAATWWLSDHSPGAVNPQFKTYAQEAADAERQSA